MQKIWTGRLADMTDKQKIYSSGFILMCLSSLLFSSSFNMLIPELTEYLTSLGGAEYKGLIIALFTLTAGISRPFSGKLADTFGRIPVMAVGSIVCFVCGMLYPILTTIAGFLFLRLVHGFSTGFKPTATSAYIADIIPQSRWGEALGIHGMCFSVGMALGPALGSYVRSAYGMNALFYTSSFFALLSIVILMNMKETLEDKQKLSLRLLKIGKGDIIAIEAIPAAVVTLLSYVSYGVILTLIPDWAHHIGVENKGLFFVVFTLFSILVRFFAGKASDRRGRISVIRTGLLLLTMALICIALLQNDTGLYLSAALYGIATGILSPAINAWTADLSHPDHRGKAMATMYIALEIGIGSGALFAGWYAGRSVDDIAGAIYITAAVTFISIIYMMRQKDGNRTDSTGETTGAGPV